MKPNTNLQNAIYWIKSIFQKTTAITIVIQEKAPKKNDEDLIWITPEDFTHLSIAAQDNNMTIGQFLVGCIEEQLKRMKKANY